MDVNTYFDIKKHIQQIYHLLEDTDPSCVDFEFFAKQISHDFDQAKTLDEVFEIIIKAIQQQHDLKLSNTRNIVQKALTEVKQKSHYSQPQIQLSIGENYWNLASGQVMLVHTDEMSQTDFYKHMLTDLAIRQNVKIISFISQSKHDKIIKSMLSDFQETESENRLEYSPQVLELKRCNIMCKHEFDENQFKYQLAYLKSTSNFDVIYLDFFQLLKTDLSDTKKEDFNNKISKKIYDIKQLAEIYNTRIVCNINWNSGLKIDFKDFYKSAIYQFKNSIRIDRAKASAQLKTNFYDITNLEDSEGSSFEAFYNNKKCLISKSL